MSEDELAALEIQIVAGEIAPGEAVATLIAEVRRLREALREIERRSDTEYWEGPEPDYIDLISINKMAREALDSHP